MKWDERRGLPWLRCHSLSRVPQPTEQGGQLLEGLHTWNISGQCRGVEVSQDLEYLTNKVHALSVPLDVLGYLTEIVRNCSVSKSKMPDQNSQPPKCLHLFYI